MGDRYAEQAVCGSILIDSRCLETLRGSLTAEDFATAWGRGIFRAACALADRGEAVDPVTIQRQARLDGVDLEADTLRQLMELTPTAANCGHYARLLQEARLRREAAQAARTLLELVQDGSQVPGQVIARTAQELQRLGQGCGPKVVSSLDASTAFLDRLQAMEDGTIPGPVQTGIHRLDFLLEGGMMAQGLYILAARPGVGKSTLGMKIAEHAAKEGPVLFVTLEMTVFDLMGRRVADDTALALGTFVRGLEGSDRRWEQVAQSASRLARTNLFFNDRTVSTVEELGAMARSIPGLRLLVVDYLNLLQGRGRTSYEQMTDLSRSMKHLAMSLGIPVLCLAQLNRESTKRVDRRPMVSDLRDSGAIEQDADAVILLHQPDQEAQGRRTAPRSPQDPVVLEACVAKCRHGKLGSCYLDFYGVNGRIREAT